jgi:hypothetical protein
VSAWSLWNRGSYQSAHAIWSARLGADTLLTNTRFETIPKVTPFDWALGSAPGVSVTRTQGLEVIFAGIENVRFCGVRQLTVIPAGRYRFTAEVSSDSLTTDQGPFFHLFDVVNSSRLNVESTLIRGTVARSSLSIDLTVKPGGGPVAISLDRHPSEHFDNKIAGTLHIYQVSLTRLNEGNLPVQALRAPVPSGL